MSDERPRMNAQHDDDDEFCDCQHCRAEQHHTCVFVGVDEHDECEVCGKVEVADEWSYWNWRDAENGVYEDDERPARAKAMGVVSR